MSQSESNERLDHATSRRLGRLSTMPVEMAGLESRMRDAIPEPVRESSRWKISFRPLYAVAASLVVGVIGVGVVISLSAPPVLASPKMLEGLYHDSAMVSGHTGMTGSDMSQVMPCCIQKVNGRPVTCVMLDANGTRVSMAVAEAKYFKVPEEAMKKEIDGHTYYVQSSAMLNMVMTVRGNTWMCVMGPVEEAELVKVLAKAPAMK